MHMAILEAEAERAARHVIKEMGISTLPVCPFAIAAKKEITVQTKMTTDPGVSGFLMRVGDEFGIFFASHIANEGFKRFSVAHELGHYFLPGHVDVLFPHGDGLHESRGNFASSDSHERQADLFAAALLMPEPLFTAAANQVGEGFPAIKELKELCQTSITATAIRYAKLTDEPVAVVVSSGPTIEYAFVSERLLQVEGVRRIRKNSVLPSDSCTAKFNRNRSGSSPSATDGAWTSLDDWFDGAPQVEMKEDVVGLGGYGKTLTVLFTDEVLDDDD